MDETTWLTATDPALLLGLLRSYGSASDRKKRLCAVAACRLASHLLLDRHHRRLIRVAKRYADATASQLELEEATRNAYYEAFWTRGSQTPMRYARAAVGSIATPQMLDSVIANVEEALARESMDLGRPSEASPLCDILRDVFGNPFRATPRIDAAVLRWNDSTVVRIAQAIYEDRRFEDMSILTDALLDAGCDNDDIVSHCRQDIPHVRGCFVLDLLLNKG